MDFCLRGSQINLVQRQKPKPKYSLQTNLHNTDLYLRSRPRSANFSQRRSRSSPFLCRPQSADPKFGRRFDSACGYYCNENDLSRVKYNNNNHKRFQSVSSSNLLKLLLDEPIKRSWLCRGGTSSPDEQSELSSSRKTASNSSLNKRIRTESIGGSSAEGDLTDKYIRPPARNFSASSTITRMSSGSSVSNISKTSKTITANDNWYSTIASISTANLFPKSIKSDLPGRVSFSKPTTQKDTDFSDCDNDRQEAYMSSTNIENKIVDESISAPGPLNITNFGFDNKKTVNEASTVTNISSSNLKKSVHFGAASGEGGNDEVLAETYEYPKCPSENCSCSTRSSSTASIHDGIESKCACDSPTCKYAVGSKMKPDLFDLKLDKQTNSKQTETTSPIEDSEVIRRYKNTVGEQLENSIVKNLLEDCPPKSSISAANLNNVQIPTYLEKHSASSKTENLLEKQNNLSEGRNSMLHSSTTAKRNLVAAASNEFLRQENKFGENLMKSASYVSSSESVINNYLKVAASAPPNITKKKENVKPSSANAAPTSSTKKAKSSTKFKSSNAASNLKKTMSFGNLREDSNLDEFQLDKVDSWMSVHETTVTRKATMKPSSTQEDFEKLRKDALEIMLDDDLDEPDNNSQTSSKTEDNSQEDSTYDEIVSVIKEIEEDKNKDNFAERSASELDLKLNTPVECVDTPQASEISGNSKSPDKYKDILNYLDNVEDSCDKTLLETRRSIPESNRSEVEFVVEPDIAEDVPKLSDLLMLPNHQLARRVVALSLRANELANAVHLSKEHLIKLRTEKQKSIRVEKGNSASRMREQKKHYETIVKRHQNFIEQLLKDKGSLCEKVAALTRRLESQNQAWEHKLETEITRMKETTMAGEKIRRERWVRENTKKIKELTVKGLELEINKMNSSHQREITELKRAHQEELLNALEDARLRHEQIENSIRESCAQDRESIIEKERTAIRERFERQLEEERKSFDEQKQKFLDDFATERERLSNELKAKEIEYQTRRQEILNEKENEHEQNIAELQEKMSKQEEKYQNRINTIEKQYEADFEIWKREYENNCKMLQVEKENTIRQHYRAERDRQIDAIVCRMDAEALKNTEEYESKLNRLKEKYEKDLKDVEIVEKSLREKFADTRNKLAESDAQVRNCEAELKQLQMELEHSKKMCNELLSERDLFRENLRHEIQNEVVVLKGERDNDIEKIHKRVQQAIEKKDVTIDIMQKENGSLRERCLKLEAVIRQQRKDYCVK